MPLGLKDEKGGVMREGGEWSDLRTLQVVAITKVPGFLDRSASLWISMVSQSQ